MKSLIIANWKMNPSSLEEAKRLFDGINSFFGREKKVDVVICPPFIYLSEIRNLKSEIRAGSQDCFWEQKGAYTGEISPLMLKNLGVEYVIIGHSERRENLAETNKMVNKKIKSALKTGLKVIFCVGEKERDEEGAYFGFLKEEIEQGLSAIPKTFLKNLFIAYEPIWAISSNKKAKADTPEELFKIVIFIRKILAENFSKKLAFEIPILYGGSVTQKNAKNFLEIDGIKGLLIGNASLDAEKLSDIVKSL